MKVTLRGATTNDIEFLFRLHRETMQMYVVQTWGQWDEAWQSQYFLDHFDPLSSQIIVAESKDIGVVSTVRRATDIFLSNIELLPAYQRQGIGAQLIRALIADACEKGLPIKLQVLKVNPAQKLYARLGFSVIGETVTHYMMSIDPMEGDSHVF
jgi:ribosomal protein S18 acetylase RimI-like enzyme